MGLHRKESQSFNGFGKILTKTIKITKTEIETKEKPQILHFQVKNTGFCQQSGMCCLKQDSTFLCLFICDIFRKHKKIDKKIKKVFTNNIVSCIIHHANGDCGEVVNTADCGSVMRGFESHYSPHK